MISCIVRMVVIVSNIANKDDNQYNSLLHRDTREASPDEVCPIMPGFD